MKLETQYLKDRLKEIGETHWLARLVRLMPCRERKGWDKLCCDLLQHSLESQDEARTLRGQLRSQEMGDMIDEGLRDDLCAEREKVQWMREAIRDLKGRPSRKSNLCRIVKPNRENTRKF